MSRWGIDPPDDDPYGVAYDGTACEDCGRPSVAWLCETCSDQRESWAAATAIRLANAPGNNAIVIPASAVVEVALVPLESTVNSTGVVEVALVPVVKQSGQFDEMRISSIRRMAKAILAADFSNIKDVA
jgi:hypothetical protein